MNRKDVWQGSEIRLLCSFDKLGVPLKLEIIYCY